MQFPRLSPGILGRGCAVALALGVLAGLARPASARDRDVLWRIVSDACVPGQSHGDPSPCVFVRPGQGGYAVLKDRKGVAQFLLIPTDRITGIEDPAALGATESGLFEAAWEARHFLERKLGRSLPRSMVSLAVNSVGARTQDQLHIHVDCTRPEVREALRLHADEIGPQWAPLRFPLAGQQYWAMWVDGEDLRGINPFFLLAQHVSGQQAMGSHDLVVIGGEREGRPGFVVLARGGPVPHGTEVQDLSCREAVGELAH